MPNHSHSESFLGAVLERLLDNGRVTGYSAVSLEVKMSAFENK
jgi:hypothetical protein